MARRFLPWTRREVIGIFFLLALAVALSWVRGTWGHDETRPAAHVAVVEVK